MLMTSDHFEQQWTFDGPGLLEPWPSTDRLTHGPRIGARTSFGRDAAAHERVAAPHDLMLQAFRQQVLAGSEKEPHRSRDRKHHPKLDPQDGDLTVGRPCAFAGDHGG